MTAKEVLVAVLRNEGAELAAHEMIRRAQHEAEGIERLSAKYLTLATEAQAERFDALLARSGLSDDELASVADSAARARCLRDCATPKLAVSTSTRRCRSSSQASPWLTPAISRPFSIAGSTAGPTPLGAGAGTPSI
jgi:hypothetical protein